MRIEKNTKNKMIIFDLDGVLINSKENMRLSWNKVMIEHNLKQNFEEYFKYVGLPFFKILKKLKITENLKDIKKTYDKNSIKFFKKIKLYPNVKNILTKLKQNNTLGLVTSKDLKRTEQIVKLFSLKFDYIYSATEGGRGKPNPFQIKKILKDSKIPKKNSYYIGDMYVDYLTCKNAKINFIFASYGYGKNDNRYDLKIKNLNELKKL
tara:strand:+ start:1242 stop:1865 length:624 start_codon:yes stop_codon:yes gene_type:complete